MRHDLTLECRLLLQHIVGLEVKYNHGSTYQRGCHVCVCDGIIWWITSSSTCKAYTERMLLEPKLKNTLHYFSSLPPRDLNLHSQPEKVEFVSLEEDLDLNWISRFGLQVGSEVPIEEAVLLLEWLLS